jgi:hypothetical protein
VRIISSFFDFLKGLGSESCAHRAAKEWSQTNARRPSDCSCNVFSLSGRDKTMYCPINKGTKRGISDDTFLWIKLQKWRPWLLCQNPNSPSTTYFQVVDHLVSDSDKGDLIGTKSKTCIQNAKHLLILLE